MEFVIQSNRAGKRSVPRGCHGR